MEWRPSNGWFECYGMLEFAFLVVGGPAGCVISNCMLCLLGRSIAAPSRLLISTLFQAASVSFQTFAKHLPLRLREWLTLKMLDHFRLNLLRIKSIRWQFAQQAVEEVLLVVLRVVAHAVLAVLLIVAMCRGVRVFNECILPLNHLLDSNR